MTEATGVDWIDEVLGGGLAPQGAYLLLGPAFSGKQRLSREFLLHGMAGGEPAIVVTTDDTAGTVRDELAELDEHLADYEKEGLLWFVDTYSASIGAPRNLSNTEYVDAAADLNKVTVAVNDILQQVAPTEDKHRLVLDSASTLATYTNAQATFRFLQVLVGRSGMAGGTQLILLESGMHEDKDVETIKHLVDGAFHFREEGGTLSIRLEGFPDVPSDRWVDFEIDDEGLYIRGSFGEGRIH